MIDQKGTVSKMTETLIEPIRQEKEYKELLREALAQSNSRKPYPVMLTGLSEGAGCAFYAAVFYRLEMR